MKTQTTYSYSSISDDGQSWIRDLRGADGFPDIDPRKMTEEERDILAAYLREDDGSLSTEDMEFSEGVADEIEALEAEDE